MVDATVGVERWMTAHSGRVGLVSSDARPIPSAPFARYVSDLSRLSMAFLAPSGSLAYNEYT